MKYSHNFLMGKIKISSLSFLVGFSSVLICPNYEVYLYLKACFFEPYRKFNSKIQGNKEIYNSGVYAPTFNYQDFTRFISQCTYGFFQSFMIFFNYSNIRKQVVETHREKELIRINNLLVSLSNEIITYESKFDQLKIVHDLNTSKEEAENFEKNLLKAREFIKNTFKNSKTDDEKELLNETLKNLVISKEDFINIIAKFNNINLNKVQTMALIENKLNTSKDNKSSSLFENNQYFKNLSPKSLSIFDKIKGIEDMTDKKIRTEKLSLKLEEINNQRYGKIKKNDININTITEMLDKNK